MGKKVMIVDDNPDLIYMVKEGLERLDSSIEVIGVNSGKQCFERLKHEPHPDIILLDIMMPEMNGWDVFSHLQTEKEWEGIPIVFLTAKTDDMSKGLGSYASTDYICKPFELKELKKRIDEIIGRNSHE
jgi:DNA-binding response OmpR family regulator